MVKYVFRNVEDLEDWRNRVIERTGSYPRITAKIRDGKHTFIGTIRH